ncbi:MAG: S8 family peptidase, partial [Ferruginibacter sp.]
MKKIFSCILASILISSASFAQEKESIPKNWHLLDASSGYQGISIDKAYALAKAKNLKSKQLIVAVIDSGVDTLHEDLKPILWRNPKEIPGNGIDDDHNGYVDDIYGWNFIGGKDGQNVKQDSYEGARVFHALKGKWDGKDVKIEDLSLSDKKEYEVFLKAKGKTVGEVNKDEVSYLLQLYPKLLRGDSVLRVELGKVEYNGNDLKTFTTTNTDAKMVKNFVLNISKANNSYEISNQQLIDEIGGQIRKADAATVAPPTYRKDIVKDDETNINDRFYGNNDVMANTPFHGTHCSGIIAAVRNNNKGMDGIADNVRIMMVRAVPDGDEHDKDIALAIRYAVDNGAKVISMSFGKDFSPQKNWVDDAFRYAEQKGVLLVHAAGNDAKDVDTEDNFPNPVYENGKGRASNVITVGASGNLQNGGLTASFSNYGKNEVDVFAPGVGIYSTIPGGNTYGNASGTSMACPVVAGVAALIMQYYPGLSAQQVKQAIEKSAQAPKDPVNKPGSGAPDKGQEKVALSELSKTGGIVNAYEALKYAGTLKPALKKEELPKSKIKKSKMG